jgi:hypothetical protein
MTMIKKILALLAVCVLLPTTVFSQTPGRCNNPGEYIQCTGEGVLCPQCPQSPADCAFTGTIAVINGKNQCVQCTNGLIPDGKGACVAPVPRSQFDCPRGTTFVSGNPNVCSGTVLPPYPPR